MSDDPRIASEHKDDSYGSCVICREWVPYTDEDWVPVAWPCAVVREARLRRIEEAARAVLAWDDIEPSWCCLCDIERGHDPECPMPALRAALEEPDVLP